jgi:hypothetical protein
MTDQLLLVQVNDAIEKDIAERTKAHQAAIALLKAAARG